MDGALKQIMKIATGSTLRSFHEQCRADRDTQSRVLPRLVGLNKSSAFGSDHGFAGIQTLSDFQCAVVPVCAYEDFQPYIERSLNSESQQLSAEKPVMFATTSGTTGASKYIPVTPISKASKCRVATKFRSPDLFEVAHILFSAAPEDHAAYEKAVSEAEQAITALQKNPGAFGTLARKLSACTSAQDEGRLGQVTRGDTVPEFETFLVNLEEGQLCPVPVRSRYGVHVLRLDRRIEGRQLPFEVVRDRIADYLQTASWQRAVAQYIRILAGQAEIRGIDLGGASTPLVQ